MKLILGSCKKDAIKGVLNELKIRMNDGEHIVIVPDRFSMFAEKIVMQSLDVKSSFNIEVVTFTRLAEKFIKRKKKCLTPEGSVMVLQQAIKNNADKLKYYRRSSFKSGFANEFYAVLTSLRNSGITPDMLLRSIDSLPNPLQGKITDTAFLYQEYLKELEARYFDSTTRLEALIEELKQNEVVKKHFYIAGFSAFKNPELEIIKELENHALSVTVGLVTGYSNSNARIYPHQTLQKLKKIANRVEEVRVENSLSCEFQKISKYLYSYDLSERSNSNGSIELFVSPSVSDEIEHIAIEIKRFVTNSGMRFSDFALAVPDLEEYVPFIKSVFSRFNLPFFIDKKEALSEQAMPKFLLSCLNVVSSHYSKDDVLQLVKNPLFGQISFDFQNYVTAYGCDHSNFLSPFKYSFGSDEESLNAEKTRQEVVALCGKFSLATTASDFLRILKDILNDKREVYEQYVEKLGSISPFYKKCCEQVEGKINSLFDEICDVFGGEKFKANEFSDMLNSMFSSQKIALVPLYIDSVFVGGTDSIFHNVKVLFVAGAVEGKMPKFSDGVKFLTDFDEQELLKYGVKIFPTTRDKNIELLFELTELAKTPAKKLYVSYPETGADGSQQKKASIVTQLCDLFYTDEREKTALVPYSTQDIESNLLYSNCDGREKEFALRLCSEENCYLGTYDKVVGGMLDDMFMQPYNAAYSLLTEAQKAGINKIFQPVNFVDGAVFKKPNREDRTSVSRLEAFFKCPYLHFFRYGLELKLKEDSSQKNNETGTIIHAVLEKFFKSLPEKENIQQTVENIFDNLMSSDRFKMLSNNVDTRGNIKRLKRECVTVCRDLFEMTENSEFKPLYIEASFKNKGNFRPLELDVNGQKISLEGKIDRVDAYNDYITVIDYKSYQIEFGLKHIYYGLDIQLYIYLSALKENLKAKCAGVFYLPIVAPFKNGTKKYELKGQVICDPVIYSALDKGPSKVKYPGKLCKNSVSYAITETDFDLLCSLAKQTAAEGYREISKGYVSAVPVEDCCEFCDFKEICAHKDENIREIDSVSIDDIRNLDLEKQAT